MFRRSRAGSGSRWRNSSEDHLVAFFLSRPLDYDPGTEQHYSNFGFVVLGASSSGLSAWPTGRPCIAWCSSRWACAGLASVMAAPC